MEYSKETIQVLLNFLHEKGIEVIAIYIIIKHGRQFLVFRWK